MPDNAVLSPFPGQVQQANQVGSRHPVGQARLCLQQQLSRCAVPGNVDYVPPGADPGWLAGWDPVISALLAATSDDPQAAAALDQQLARYQDSTDWGALVAALRRLRSGQTGPELLAGLDETCAAIITCALDAQAGKTSIPPSLWPAMGLGPFLTDVVDAARVGDITGGRARPELEAMAAQPLLAPLTVVITQILGGDRNPALAAQLSDPTLKAVVMTVLHHVGTD